MTRQELSQIKRDPSVSYWLKGAIERAEQRDPLDALRDAELMLCVCKLLCAEAGIKAEG